MPKRERFESFAALLLASFCILAVAYRQPKAEALPPNIEDISAYTQFSHDKVASNGTTPVTLVTANATRDVKPVKFSVRNSDNIWHTGYVSCVVQGAAGWYPVEIPPGGEVYIDNDHASIRTFKGAALQFKIDNAGSGSSCTYSGLSYQ